MSPATLDHQHGSVWRPLLVACLLICNLGWTSLAQTTPPLVTPVTTLEQLRSQFHSQILSKSQVLTEQYERALARLESDFALAGEYEQARQIKQRREQLLAPYQRGSADTGASTSLSIPVPAAAAKGSGVVADEAGMLTGWRSSSHYAEWTGLKITPGDYFVDLEYLVLEAPLVTNTGMPEPEDEVVLEIYEVSLLAGAAENRRSFALPLSRDKATFTNLRIGPVRYSRSPITLRITGTESYPGNIIRLRNLQLTPAASTPVQTVAATPSASPATAPTKTIASIRQTLAASLAEAYAPIRQTYLERLQQAVLAHPEWAPFATAETRLHAHRPGSEKKASSLLTPLGLPKPLASLSGIAGYEDLTGVSYISSPDNTGDRFRVRHGDQEMVIRLLWVQCAPAVPVGTAVAETAFSRHFAIAPEDASLFGRAAQEFTSGYLEGRNFQLLAREKPDPDGVIPALLFLPDIGLFQHLLVDQGLAAVVARNPSGGTLERALLRSLLDREREASQRNPRPGAWSLSPLTAPPATKQP